MLVIYIEALLVDEDLADQVWTAQDSLTMNDEAACVACVYIVLIRDRSPLVT
jgi:hypothetical protein